MGSPQTATQQTNKSRGQDNGHDNDALDGASDAHAIGRLSLGFDMMEVMSEYRALRASVLRLWHDSTPDHNDRDVNDLTRFNESIDQSVCIALASYTKRVDQARDMFLAILGHDLRNPLGAISMTKTFLPLVSDNKSLRVSIFDKRISMTRLVRTVAAGEILTFKLFELSHTLEEK
jgi:signal transduction histidine kinase